MAEVKPSYDSVTEGLIESLTQICRALRQRPLHKEGAKVALAKFRLDPDVRSIFGVDLPLPSPSPCSPLEPPLTPTHLPTPTGNNADPSTRTLAMPIREKQATLFKTSESLPPSIEEVVQAWNGYFSLTRVNTLGKRIPLIQKALQDEFFAENWREGLKRLVKTPFCTGKNARKWKADFEWFCDPVNLDRLLSGKYDNLSSTSEPPVKDYAREEI